jgi:hypothetical protein
MNVRVVAAMIVAVPFLSAQAQAQDRQVLAATQAQIRAEPEAEKAKSLEAKSSEAKSQEDGFIGPRFRKGLWRFIRTMDIVRSANKNIKYRVVDNEMTRCVDPTNAMKATFASAPVGSCISDKPEKVGNKYVFGRRCDYMGAVSTVITVHSDESYTEVNEVQTGESPKTDLVTAKRIGDCGDDRAEDSARASVSSLQQ